MAIGVDTTPGGGRFGGREAASVGIVLGCLAFLLALPPIGARAPFWPAVAGVPAIAAGIWAVSRGVKRAGWGAVAAGTFGIALGILSTRAGAGNLDEVVGCGPGQHCWSALLTQTLIFATPLTFAAIGGMFSERSGVVNIGLEGMMLTGAFFGILGTTELHHWYFGLLVAALAGGLMALIHAFVSINLRADQIVSGTAVNFLALGVTGYFFIKVYGDQGVPGSISQIPNVSIPGAGHVGLVGDVFGNLNLMIWLAFALLVLSYVVMFKTPIGLRIRSVGEHPRAADTVGISVYRTRYAAVVTSGVLAALGGAYLSIGFVGSFNENMTAGRGFIGLAALIFGNWRPFGAFAAALLFGFSTALSFRLQGPWGDVSSHNIAVLFQALPYVLTLIAVVGVIGRSIPPAAVGRPYVKQ